MRRGRVIVVIGGILLAGALILPRIPRQFEATGTLDECSWGWPIVVFDGPDPKEQWTVEEWPTALRYDMEGHALLGADGQSTAQGDRVKVTGQIIEVHGDIPPCFQTMGVRVEAVVAP